MKRALSHLSVLFCIAFGFLYAQEFRSSILGRVTDPQNAVITGAKIVAVQAERGARFETESTGDGQYSLPYLTPGTYRITAEMAGFKGYVQDAFSVGANQRVGLDIRLEVGAVSDTVKVTTETPLIQTASASVGGTVSERQLEVLPMNGRSPLGPVFLSNLVAFTGDLTSGTKPTDKGRMSSMVLGGTPGTKAEFLLDGAANMDGSSQPAFTPIADAVQEVKVEAFVVDAAYGHTGSGTVTVVTKSGTNQLHGSILWFNQATALAANDFFSNASGKRKQVKLFNQYGMTAGGPIYIPKVFDGRNKLFFFFGYEGFKTRSTGTGLTTVPTPAERTGDFSALLNLANPIRIYDPATGVASAGHVLRQQFPNNIVPASRISAGAQKILSFYPQANLTGLADGETNFIGLFPSKDDYSSFMGRVDINISDRQKLFYNYRQAARLTDSTSFFPNVATGGPVYEWPSGSSLDHVYTISPTLLLNSRLNWTRKVNQNKTYGAGYDFTQLGFPQSLAAKSQEMAFPQINLSPFQQLGGGSRQRSPFDTFQIFEDATKATGRHVIKAGVDLRLNRSYAVTTTNSAGAYTFGTNWTNGPQENSGAAPIGQELAGLLLGLPTSGSFDYNAALTASAKYYALFVHDDIRVSRNLSVNVGLRFERDLPTTEKFNRSTNGFDFTAVNAISAAAAAAYAKNPVAQIPASQFKALGGLLFAGGTNGRDLYSLSGVHLSPRIGLSEKIGDKTVVRAGTGVFFIPMLLTGVNQNGFSASSPIVATNDGGLTPASTISNPFPNGLIAPSGATLGVNTNLGQSVSYMYSNPRNGYSVRWNVSVQRELAADTMLEVGYTGNHAVHMLVNRSLDFVPQQYLSTSPVRDQATIDRLSANVPNPFAGLLPGSTLNGSNVQLQQLLYAYPEFSAITQNSYPEGSGYYNALQTKLEKRFSRGYNVAVNYAWSKLMERRARLNPGDAALTKVMSDDDRPQKFSISSNWDLPFGKGQAFANHAPRIVNAVIGGWNLNGLFMWQVAHPLAWGNVIYYGGDLKMDPHNPNRAFDTTRFNTVAAQQLASNERTFPLRFSNVRSDSMKNVDMSLVKSFTILEKVRAQFRCESFNLPNHAIFSDPNLTATSSLFGKITSLYNRPRLIQVALRLAW